MRSASSWFCDSFADEAFATLRILPRSGRMACVSRDAGALRGAAGRVALDDENLRSGRRLDGAVGELAGQAQLARRRLAADLFLALALQPVLGLVDRPLEQLRRLHRAVGQPVVERVAHGALDDARGFLRGEAILGLALEFRLADEHRQHGGGRAHHVVGGDLSRAAVIGQLAIGAQALGQRRAQAVLVRAAVGRRDGVAVGARKPSSSAIQATAHSTEPWPFSPLVRPANRSLVTIVRPAISLVR